MLQHTTARDAPARDSRRRRRCVGAVVTLTVVVAAGCNRAGAAGAASGNASDPSSAGSEQASAAGAGSHVQAIPANSDPCGWIPTADATRLLGPLAAAPRRGHDAENTDATTDGRACVFTLSGAGPGGLPREVAVEVVPGEAGTEQATIDAGAALVQKILSNGKKREAQTDERSHARDGWDYANWIPDQFLGRLGHVAVRVGLHDAVVPRDSAERLAALVRDRLPDLPFAAEERKWNHSDDPDPCALLTRAEAEAVLGKLAVPPYRSNGDTPLADPGGDGCSYYAPRHRVFTLKPEWKQGKTLFQVATGASRALGGIIGQLAGAGAPAAADTLEGNWDQAGAGLDGELYLLKGDRMLTVAYRTAAIDVPTALRLTTPAVKRLAAR